MGPVPRSLAFLTRKSEIAGEIFENCIEKNFHVSHKYMRAAALRQARSDRIVPRCADGRCNFALVEIKKGIQVDTLVPQATKDVPSCEKLRGAAKKR